MAAKRNEKPQKRLNTVALRLDDDELEELRRMADAEVRPLANLLVVLIREAVAARQKGTGKKGDA